jgi:hypothetical protein
MVLRLLTLFAFTLPLAGQSWDELRSLKVGEEIKVQDTKGQESKGAFRSVSADAIALTTGKSEASIERSRVRRVQVRSGSRRARNAAIGAAVGVAIGVAVDQTLGAFFRNEGGQNEATRALTYIAPIGLLGGLGGAFPAYRTVYKAR